MAFNVIWGLYLKHSKGSSAFPRRAGAGRAKSATGADGRQEIRANSWRQSRFCGARAKEESFSSHRWTQMKHRLRNRETVGGNAGLVQQIGESGERKIFTIRSGHGNAAVSYRDVPIATMTVGIPVGQRTHSKFQQS
jgi:hypothetical protein